MHELLALPEDATDGPWIDAEAIVTLHGEAWSALVTDFDMPDLDGAALAREARAVAADLPIVLCTALADGREAAGARAGLFDEVVSKPVLPDRLIRAVQAAMLARKARRCT